MRSCKEVSRLLSDAQDRKLAWGERFELKLHVFICRMCQRLAVQFHAIDQAARALCVNETEDPQYTTPAKAKERIIKYLRSKSNK